LTVIRSKLKERAQECSHQRTVPVFSRLARNR
jgi:hypothetical protein